MGEAPVKVLRQGGEAWIRSPKPFFATARPTDDTHRIQRVRAVPYRAAFRNSAEKAGKIEPVID